MASGTDVSGIARALRRFAADESGSVTVETVLWLPFLFGLLMLFIDVSLAFFGRAQAFRVIQDFNRMVAVGAIEDPAVARTRLLASFERVSAGADASVVVNCGVVTTVMTIPVSDLVKFTSPFLIQDFSDRDIVVGATHFVEFDTACT